MLLLDGNEATSKMVTTGAIHNMNTIYTVGYQSHTPDSLLETLRIHEIGHVIDVRANAISRKRGFSKKALKEWIWRAGLTYTHIPALGIPSCARKTLPRLELLKNYEDGLSAAELHMWLKPLGQFVGQCATVLLCLEERTQDCHRKPLATYLAAKSDLEVIHL